MPGSIITLGAFVAAVLLYLLYLWQFPDLARTLTPPMTGAVLARWTGGYKTRFLFSASGTAQLELFDWGIRVSGLGLLFKQMLPRWEVRYHELRTVQHVRWRIFVEGVLLRTDGSALPLLFISTRCGEILAELARRGVPVDNELARLNRSDLRP
jgi:hypothetical protein